MASLFIPPDQEDFKLPVPVTPGTFPPAYYEKKMAFIKRMLEKQPLRFGETRKHISEDLYREQVYSHLPFVRHCDFHDGSCMENTFYNIVRSFQNSFQVYFLIHMAPFLIWKRKQLRENPSKIIKEYLTNLTYSMNFATFYRAIGPILTCLQSRYYKKNGVMEEWMAWQMGFIGGFSIFCEKKQRWAEISMYVAPRWFELVKSFIEKRGYIQNKKSGLRYNVVFALAVGTVYWVYLKDMEKERIEKRKLQQEKQEKQEQNEKPENQDKQDNQDSGDNAVAGTNEAKGKQSTQEVDEEEKQRLQRKRIIGGIKPHWKALLGMISGQH